MPDRRSRLSRQTRRAAALASSLFLAIGPRATVGASDAPWPRLPDGRVVIEIKGERLAFDPTLKDGVVEFTGFSHKRRLWLRDVVEGPSEARLLRGAAFRVGAHEERLAS
jgi:hypothetical protein